MTQVSKYPVSKEVYDRIFDIFLKTFSNLYSREISTGFFSEFLSPTEQVMLAKRLAISFLLSKNFHHRDISRVLRVSTATVNRVAFSYNKGKYFPKVIKSILASEKMDEFWLNIGEVITKILGQNKLKGNEAWRYLHAEIKKKQKKDF